MIPDLAIWVIAIALGIIALPTLLAILLYAGVGAFVGLYTLYELLREFVREVREQR